MNENVATVNSAYGDLAKRGETLVGRIRKQESTKATTSAAKTTTAKAKATKTQAEEDHQVGRQDGVLGHEVDRQEDRRRRDVDRQEDHDGREEVLRAEQREGDHDRRPGDRVERDLGRRRRRREGRRLKSTKPTGQLTLF